MTHSAMIVSAETVGIFIVVFRLALVDTTKKTSKINLKKGRGRFGNFGVDKS